MYNIIIAEYINSDEYLEVFIYTRVKFADEWKVFVVIRSSKSSSILKYYFNKLRCSSQFLMRVSFYRAAKPLF